jgi:hypothetical protein
LDSGDRRGCRRAGNSPLVVLLQQYSITNRIFIARQSRFSAMLDEGLMD